MPERHSRPTNTPLLATDLTRDAHELAKALSKGRGNEALDLIFGGAHPAPADKAILLRATAAVLESAS